jgi:hypothetical protein
MKKTTAGRLFLKENQIKNKIMSERWKYQLKTGGFWGIFMSFFNLLFEMQEKPISIQLISSAFYIRSIGFILVGIFVLGYFNWKVKVKKEAKN